MWLKKIVLELLWQNRRGGLINQFNNVEKPSKGGKHASSGWFDDDISAKNKKEVKYCTWIWNIIAEK